jgi:hypothetical protein
VAIGVRRIVRDSSVVVGGTAVSKAKVGSGAAVSLSIIDSLIGIVASGLDMFSAIQLINSNKVSKLSKNPIFTCFIDFVLFLHINHWC